MSAPPKLLTIGVTGLNAHDNPGPGVAVIRSLREFYRDGLRIVGLAYESLEPGIYMGDMVDVAYQVPYPSTGSAALLERLAEINGQEQLDVIIPNFDSELFNFIKISAQMAKMGIKTCLPTHAQLAARDKINLGDFGTRYHFKVPAFYMLNSVHDIDTAAEGLNYPLVIKGKFYEAQIVNNRETAQKAFYDLSAKWGLPVIAQQYISGTEINVAGLGDGKGNAVSVVPMRKLYITDKGKAWAGITIEDNDLIALGRQFAAASQWKGGFELEIMKDANGDLYVLEVNPRFPAWVYLTVAAGQNQPAALVQLALGNEVKPFKNYQAGKMFIRYSWDEVVDIGSFQQFSAFGRMANTNNNKGQA
ncbi:ATP-grasp domain-containing protein [Mucilaginibacter glaciei]|uniref:ATP-grasp domain-containing protein n=1 Tax=Mucilaginibacter glaciei TaxID=2772109 RepID=A0A926NLS0_9SPHI|nr:ATP-grasp domain-containing protein [Mucilaginibacter glaciei]MBD1391548.1 ATP-grasp domain-containing protein [Mucilaginibacter glaciei]